MGCDIHAFTEVRRPNGLWQYTEGDEDPGEDGNYDYEQQKRAYAKAVAQGVVGDDLEDLIPRPMNTPDINRNYWLFGTLHDDVRCSFPFSLPGKGFPEDASDPVAADFKRWDMDAHSPSYLTLAELKLLAATLMISNEEHARDICGSVVELISEMPPHTGDPEDQRLVFWFDN